MIIVSDAKTLNVSNAAEDLKQLITKVKKIYWLNPIPEKDWRSIAGIDGLRPVLHHAGLQHAGEAEQGL